MKKQKKSIISKSNFYQILATIITSLAILLAHIILLYKFYNQIMCATSGIWQVLASLVLLAFSIIMVFVISLAAMHRLKQYAISDMLTGLCNMYSFVQITGRYIKKQRQKELFVAWLDIRGFSLINQRYGVGVGEEVILLLADFLKRNAQIALAARVEGDNFAILVKKGNKEEAKRVVADLIQLVKQKIKREKNINIELIAGVCLHTKDIKDGEDILERAHIAQNIARERQLAIVFFDKALNDSLIEEDKMAEDILLGLARDEFKVYYQPKYNIINGEMVGVEALVRWQHPELGLLLPIKFLSTAAKKGVLAQIDDFVFERVCTDIKKWQSGNIYVPVSVNCEKEMFTSQTIFDSRFEVMQKHGIYKGDIQFEITERVAIEDSQKTVSMLKKLQAKGYTVIVDDFGTGYSSLSMLRDLPVDAVKLDISFIKKAMLDEMDREIISNFVELFNILGLEAVAEGVETLEELSFLKECGITCVQGFLLDFPLSEEHLFEKFQHKALLLVDRDVLEIINVKKIITDEVLDVKSSSFYYRNILIKGNIDFLEVDLTSNIVIYNGLTPKSGLISKDSENALSTGKSYSISSTYFIRNHVVEADKRRVAAFLNRKSLLNRVANGIFRASVQFNLQKTDKILILGELSVVLIEDKNKTYAIIKYKDVKD